MTSTTYATRGGDGPAGAPITDGSTALPWTLVVGALAGTVAVARCVDLGPVTGGRAAGLVVTLVGIVAIGAAMVIHRPATARSWLLVAAGCGARLTAALAWPTDGAAPPTLDAQLALVVAMVATAHGLVLLARHQTRVWDRSRWIDATVVALSLGTITVALLMAPQAGAPWAVRWLGPLYPAADVLVVLFAVRSLLAVRRRSPSLRLLALGLIVVLAGDVLTHWVAPAGVAIPAGTAGLTAGIATVLIAAGALHPSVTSTPNATIAWRRLGAVRFTVLVASLVAPLAVLAGLALGAGVEAAEVVAIAAGTTVIGVLVLVRVSGLVSYADLLADERHRSRFESLADHSHDAVVILDASEAITWASPAVRHVLAHPPEDLHGRTIDVLLGGAAARAISPALDRLRRQPAGTTIEIRTAVVGPDGREREIEGVATNLLDDQAVEGIVLVARDITERSEMQRQLEEQAFVDPLTGLANRALFIDRVTHALSRARPDAAAGMAVLFVDLDDFKGVNDSLGHGHGDDLLVAVGRRIADALRPADTAARLGGDEFAVLLEDTTAPDALAAAERVLALISVPFEVGEFAVRASASVGVAMADDPTHTTAVLLRNADLAMYEAKKDGKGQVRAYRPELHERELRQFHFRTELQAALERDELRLLYQPIVDMETEAVVGAEALLRWVHPEHGTVSPLEFIPLAESTRAIVPIGRWVLRTACEQLAAWSVGADGPFSMDVNVSAVQLMDATFVGDVAAILTDTRIDPGRVVLELTESILVHDADAARSVLERLRALGVRLAIDDFGTGYSSLAYLQNFPIDIVKIDRAFVNQLGQAGRGRSLARSIIAIAGSLGIDTIAEGIETPAQAADLSALACVHGQGFHYSRPVDAAAFGALLERADEPVG